MIKRMIGAAVVGGLLLASVATQPVSAWHPVGKITKQVQNVTTSSGVKDANTAEAAVEVKSEDLLMYYITVSNEGQPDANGWNDMVGTVMTDTLPEGVELVANRTQRTITVDLGTIKPGEKVTKEYQVKVSSTKNKEVITNKACFTGDSAVNDSPQQGCDDAVIKTNIPQTSSTTTTTPTPAPAPKPAVQSAAVAKTLPKTGMADVLRTAGLVTAAGVVIAQVRLRRAAKAGRV